MFFSLVVICLPAFRNVLRSLFSAPRRDVSLACWLCARYEAFQDLELKS
jgi:hypothetical protein